MQNDVNVYPTRQRRRNKNGFFPRRLQSESANNKLQLAPQRLEGGNKLLEVYHNVFF